MQRYLKYYKGLQYLNTTIILSESRKRFSTSRSATVGSENSSFLPNNIIFYIHWLKEI